MDGLALDSLHSVERLLARPNPVARLEVKELGPAQAQLLLQYAAAEQARSYEETWEIVQIILGTFFFFFLLFGTTENKFSLLLALLMIVVVLGERLLLTPELASIGRSIDFTPDVPSGNHTQIQVLRAVYFALEALKWGLGALLGAFLILQHRAPRSGYGRRRTDVLSSAANSQTGRQPRPAGD